MSVNKVILVGNLGKDPEIKYTPSGTAVSNFSLATSETFTKDGERQQKTEWHNIVAFGKTAELTGQYLKKGSQVYIEGKLTTRSWDDKEGVKRYMVETIVNSVQFLDSKNDAKTSAASNTEMKIDTSPQFAQDEIPF